MSFFRIAAVSFLNARPLICGLDEDPGVSLQLDVPSGLLDRLRDGSCDVALLPTIDYQKLSDARLIASGGIGCDGPTLTVRLFAKRPIEKVHSVACDTDSHTSIALTRIILAELHGTKPEFVDRGRASGKDDQATLLIGDKVVCEEPLGYPHQYDLGAEWKKLTGLPFVFAVWTTRQGVELGDLPKRLEQAKYDGLHRVGQLVEKYALPRGWPGELARQYLTSNLKFDIGESQLQAIRQFHEKAAKHGLIDTIQPLRIYGRS
ncbi:MAG TPA: menaquinone biosynthesis protein [Tepidisphaeraceae bacterium]|nr:menaquinone biosynthesis protein [Tepidisphaeraceae bacterium]